MEFDRSLLCNRYEDDEGDDDDDDTDEHPPPKRICPSSDEQVDEETSVNLHPDVEVRSGDEPYDDSSSPLSYRLYQK